MKHTRIILCALAALSAASCTSYKEILYLQDLSETNQENVDATFENRIQPGDRLAIIVTGPDKMVTAPYNLTLGEIAAGGTTTDPEVSTLPYFVDKEGYITFPKLERIHVAGMTQQELRDYLAAEIRKDVKEAIVHVTIKNFKVHIMGEVRNPGWYTIESDHNVTIFQALSRAGDLALTAKRDGVIVLREENGVQNHYVLDLKSKEVFNSPAYFIQQNDVIMVQPSASRVAAATTATGIWSTVLSSISTSLAVVSLVISNTRK